jgi:hypothetical protein
MTSLCRSIVILTSGFPPPDANVRDWLLQSKTKPEAFSRAGAFLCALFVALLDCLQHIDERIDDIKPIVNEEPPKSKEAKFRLFMTAGQTFTHQGQYRREFYEGVLRFADQVRSPDIFTFEYLLSPHFLLALPTTGPFRISTSP